MTPKKPQISVSARTYERIAIAAKQRDMTMSAFVEARLCAFLDLQDAASRVLEGEGEGEGVVS